MDKKILLIYHKEDNDGVFSGALFYDYLMRQLHMSKNMIQLLPADYNALAEFSRKYEDIDDLKDIYGTVVMLDISFNDAGYMKKLAQAYGGKFFWCDHHQAIIKESEQSEFDDIPGIRNKNKSAILCTYEFLYDPFNIMYDQGGDGFPEILRILSAWDSFSYVREGYGLDYVRDVNKGVTETFHLDFNKVLEYVHNLIDRYCYNHTDLNMSSDTDINFFKDLGHQLNDYDDNKNKELIKNYGDMSWMVADNRNACALFIQGVSSSLMFKNIDHIQNGIVFKRARNQNWTISLYNADDNDDFDCGAYLKEKYRGGGHKGAAGCTVTEDQFIKILKSKKI